MTFGELFITAHTNVVKSSEIHFQTLPPPSPTKKKKRKKKRRKKLCALVNLFQALSFGELLIEVNECEMCAILL